MVSEQDQYYPFHPNFMTASSPPDTHYVKITGVLFGADGAAPIEAVDAGRSNFLAQDTAGKSWFFRKHT
jgi:hypothetical protein